MAPGRPPGRALLMSILRTPVQAPHYGYSGSGYYGGYWRGRQFYYNQAVNNVNVTNIHNVYNTTVVNKTTT